MKKIETIWHELLYSALKDKKYRHTQQDLARQFGYSLSTVNLSLKIPAQIGAVRKTSKFFVLENFTKLLYLWASVRNLEKDIVYHTYVDASISEIEGLLPDKSIYACYTAGKKILIEAPSDYAKVYFYINPEYLEIVTTRFPKDKKREPNLFALKNCSRIEKYGSYTDLALTFVDLWNLKDWYSHDFTKSLEKKMNELLS